MPMSPPSRRDAIRWGREMITYVGEIPVTPREEARWRAVIRYHTEASSVEVMHFLSEIADLDNIVELGPHWDTVLKIEIFRINHRTGAHRPRS
jgi:hypothetical protein